MSGRRAGLAALLCAGAALCAAPAAGQQPAVGGIPAAPLPSQAAVRPGLARIGEPVLYRGRVVVPRGTAFRWLEPAAGGAFEWGEPQSRRIAAYPGSRIRWSEASLAETVQVEILLQAFTPGILTVPGLGFEVRAGSGPARAGQLPTVRLAVAPVVSPGDTSATLRPLRGPLAAPWWERVPWRIVGAAALAVVVVAVVVRRARRGRVAQPGRTEAPPARDPAAVALAALEALRGLRLPEHGRFGEHALHLTRILRRFLEATLAEPRPGDTTDELLAHLGTGPLSAAERERLAGLLAAWDRLKFARAAGSAAEAGRAESAVEDLVRRRAQSAGEQAA